jgi:hypothetical protein
MAVKRYNGTSWDVVAGKGDQGTSSSITTWVKTASGGETSLSGNSDSSTTLAYTPGQEQFFINGVLQVRGSDYTATNGTSITGITALVAGDIATVTSVNAFSVTGAVPLSTVTANGDLIVGTSSGAVGRLGIGSTGQVLSVSGGAPAWATPTAGGMTLITSTSLNGVSQVNFTSIPQTYQELRIVLSGCTNAAGGYIPSFQFNGVTASVYNYATFEPTIASTQVNTGYEAIRCNGYNVGSSSTSNNLVATIPNYYYTGGHTMSWQNNNDVGSTPFRAVWGIGNDGTNAGAITSIRFYDSYGSRTFNGGTIALYGVK